MPVSNASPSTTLRQTFDSIDRNRDSALTKAEVKRSMEDAGVGAGFFGGMKVDGATDALVAGLDADKSGRVAWDEYVKGGHQLAPAGMKLDPAQMQDPAHVDAAVAALYRDADADRDGKLSHDELAAHQTRVAEQQGQSNASIRGDIAATLALKNLDVSGDGKLAKPELAGFLKDVAREQQARTAPKPQPIATAPAAAAPAAAPAPAPAAPVVAAAPPVPARSTTAPTEAPARPTTTAPARPTTTTKPKPKPTLLEQLATAPAPTPCR